jgi:hypothetical protein
LPNFMRYWDTIGWEQVLPPSETALKVTEWIASLRTNADATLDI